MFEKNFPDKKLLENNFQDGNWVKNKVNKRYLFQNIFLREKLVWK